jgi:hypothetical protein
LQKYSKHVSNFMKFDYGVTNGECVDKKKFGEQNLKKKKTNCLPCAAPLAHGKVSVCRVPASSTRQTKALPCA